MKAFKRRRINQIVAMGTHAKTANLSTPEEIKKALPVSSQAKETQVNGVRDISAILDDQDPRKLVILGPCSADFEDSLLEYGEFIAGLQEEVRGKLLLVMRFYTGKPRTIGGWRGIQQQSPDGNGVDIEAGLRESRRLALKLLEMGISLADEMLHPQFIGHFSDIYSYLAIGARSVENQYHREVSAGAPMPIGMKNPTSGDLCVLANSIKATQGPSDYTLANGRSYHGDGNSHAHGILRGSNFEGNVKPNYDETSIVRFLAFTEKVKLLNPKLLIDTNHDNSGKKPEKQIEIMRDVLEIAHRFPELRPVLKGFMVESYLFDGRQDGKGEVKHGLSLTDPCIGKEKTRELILELADNN